MVLWALLAFIVVVVVALMASDGRGELLGLPNREFGQLAFLVAVLVFVGSALVGRALRPGDVFRAIVFWSLLAAVLVGAYAYRDELAGVGGRVLGVLAPGVPISGRLVGATQDDAVVITRADRGHFAVWGSVNGQPVNFLVDTGASFVTLTTGDAARLGIETNTLRFNIPIRTANGVIRAAPIIIEALTIGAIERAGVRALVAPPRTLEQSLLGLSFLDTLEAYTVSGDRLVLAP